MFRLELIICESPEIFCFLFLLVSCYRLSTSTWTNFSWIVRYFGQNRYRCGLKHSKVKFFIIITYSSFRFNPDKCLDVNMAWSSCLKSLQCQGQVWKQNIAWERHSHQIYFVTTHNLLKRQFSQNFVSQFFPHCWGPVGTLIFNSNVYVVTISVFICIFMFPSNSLVFNYLWCSALLCVNIWVYHSSMFLSICLFICFVEKLFFVPVLSVSSLICFFQHSCQFVYVFSFSLFLSFPLSVSHSFISVWK